MYLMTYEVWAKGDYLLIVLLLNIRIPGKRGIYPQCQTCKTNTRFFWDLYYDRKHIPLHIRNVGIRYYAFFARYV
jgi:hypothetical protein